METLASETWNLTKGETLKYGKDLSESNANVRSVWDEKKRVRVGQGGRRTEGTIHAHTMKLCTYDEIRNRGPFRAPRKGVKRCRQRTRVLKVSQACHQARRQ